MEAQLIPYVALPRIPATSVIVLAPHPDDEVFGCGGLLHAYRRDDIPVRVILMTSGDHGDHGQQGAAVREQESLGAAAVLGYADIRFWREPDRRVCFNERLIGRVLSEITSSGADLILAPWIGELHPDHRATAWIAIEAARRALPECPGLRLAFFEVSMPLARVNTLVDITSALDAKRSAMACFVSQLAVQAYDRQVMSLNHYRSYTLGPHVDAAEAYWLLQAAALSQPALLGEPPLLWQWHHRVDADVVGEKVSVLIRSMNRATLARALDSIALQTYPNIEVVVLNVSGGPHLPLGDRCGPYPLRFLDSAQPLPRSVAANRLFECLDSRYAIFLDDDDWFLPDHVGRLVLGLIDDPSAPAATSDVDFGEMVNGQWQSEHVFEGKFDPDRFVFENYLPIHAVLMRVSSLREGSGCRFDEALSLYEDWDFWLQLSEIGPFRHVPGISACYCRNPDGSGAQESGERQAVEREKLVLKWRLRLSEKRYQAFLEFAKHNYRAAARATALGTEFEKAREYAEDLAQRLQRRERELEEAGRHAEGLQQTLSAREHELAETALHAAGLQEILRARESELEGATGHAAGLQHTLDAREHDLDEAGRYVADLQRSLAAKEVELASWQKRSADLEGIVAARNQEIIALKQSFWQKMLNRFRVP